MKSLLLAIIINELMASNVGTVMSPATNFDSWVEFYNTSEQAVDLSGMYLSNDGDDLTRWQMPVGVGTIPAKGFLVVWLGSNDISKRQAPFKLDCDGGTLYLSDQDGGLVTSVTYPEAKSRTSWARKTDGGGEWGWTADVTPGASNATATFCEKRLDPPVVNVGSRLFQQPFNIEVTIPKGTTLMYTTDGTVPTMAVTEASEQEATWTEWLKNGDCEGDDASCFVSHDAGGGGDVNRIVDGIGVNGSRGLKVHAIENAEHAYEAQFFVYTPDHVWLVDEPFHFQMKVRADKEADISTESHTTPHNYHTWSMLGNNYHVTTEWQDISFDGRITEEQAGMQTIAFNLNVDPLDNNYYFDNLSWQSYSLPEPTVNTGGTALQSKDGKFTVNKTTNYVFRLFQNGFLPSVPVTRSFIQTDREYTIPIVSVVGDDRYFNDPMWGIDVKGKNGIPGNGSDDPVNWNQPWNRPVNFSYISPTEGMLFNQDVNISVSGGWTRASSPRSMKLKSNKVFDGQNRFDYSFFPQKPYIRNKTLLVRNGGNDIYSGSRFMDPALTTIIQRSGIDLDVQSFVQVVEYINGQFKGVLNLREPNNDDFVYANWGYDDEEIDAFENGTFKNGDNEVYNHLCEIAADINAPGVYEEVKQLLDVDEFANYMAAELYLGNNDWPDNNVKGYRSRNDGRFRFVCYDLDYAFNSWGEESFQKLQSRTSVKMVALFLNLLKHDGFRRSFIDRYCIMAGSVFEKDRATAIVDELADAMRPMSQFDGKLPDNSAKKIKEKLQNRVDEMTNQLKQYEPMMLRNVTQQSVVLTSDAPAATLYINGLEVPYATFVGQLFPPVRLEAKAPAGYTFTGWKKSTGSTVRILKSNDTWKYYDKGEVTNDGWRGGSSFSDASWSSGQAPLGYSMNGIKTTISYGSDAERKNPTTYFRKTITLSETPTAGDVFQLNYQLDDGCIVWVNGKEAGRVNMRSGTVNYDNFSSTYAGSDPLTGTLNISPTLFQKGSNVIAVEVHNTSYTSSDLFWACELFTTVGGSKDEDIITEAAIDLPNDPTLVLKACFEPLPEAERQRQHITPVRINEVSADDGIYVNDYYKRKDWIELYNTTDAPVDVEGMYLSDSPEEKPKKYQISRGNTVASTIIPAHGYLVIWCDKESPLAQLHASFKLAAEGDELQLMAKDGSWTDRFVYPAHTSDQTVGRYPDGSNHVYVMNIPTIAKANITSSYVIEVEQPYNDATGIRETMALEGDGKVYNLKGQTVQGTLAPGIYIRNGKKFIIR